MTDRPCAAVLLPGGTATAPDDTGPRTALWSHVVAPAIADAGWEPVRLRVGPAATTIARAILDRLVLCDAVIADVTRPDLALSFAIGAHHGARPGWQVLLGARPDRPDAGPAPRSTPDAATPVLRYNAGPDGAPADPADLRGRIAAELTRLRAGARPLPLHHLVDGPVDELLAHEVTDVFRDRARYPDAWRERLAAARSDGVAAVRATAAALEPSATAGVGEVIDLLLSFRAVGAADEVVRLVEDLPPPLATAALVREQYALALNRIGHRAQARAVLEELIAARGVTSERCALLGRVHKDAWVEAASRGDDTEADRCLGRAIDAYVAGFDHDWRDPYPGINAIVLMELREPPDPRGAGLLPLVRHAARRRMRSRSPDYWDHATVLELAVLEGDESAAGRALDAALAAVREEWEPRTTGVTLARLRQARARRGVDTSWLQAIEEALAQAPVVRR